MPEAQVRFHMDILGEDPPEVVLADTGSTVAEAIDKMALPVQSCSAFLEDDDLMPEYVLKPGDRVDVFVAPQGGLDILGFVITALITTAVSAVVSIILNHLFRPKAPDAQAEVPAPDAVYNIGQVENQVLLGKSIPVGFGQFIITPPLAATPYVQYRSNDQYLMAIYCLGIGSYTVDRVYLADENENSLGYDVVEWKSFTATGHGKTFGRMQNAIPWPHYENVFTTPQVQNMQLTPAEGYNQDNRKHIVAAIWVSAKTDAFYFHFNSDRESDRVHDILEKATHLDPTGSNQVGSRNTGRYTITNVWQSSDKGLVKVSVAQQLKQSSSLRSYTQKMKAYRSGNTQVLEGFHKNAANRVVDRGGVYYTSYNASIALPNKGELVAFNGSYWICASSYYSGQKGVVRLSPTRDSNKFLSANRRMTWTVMAKRSGMYAYDREQGTVTPFYKLFRESMQIRKMELDFQMPNGCCSYTDNGALTTAAPSYRIYIRRDGSNTTVWSKTIKGAGWGNPRQMKTNTPQRWTVHIQLTGSSGTKDDTGRKLSPGNYKVAVRRLGDWGIGGRNPQTDLYFVGAKGMSNGKYEDGSSYPKGGLYYDTSMLAVRMKASDLSEVATRRLRVRMTRRLTRLSGSYEPYEAGTWGESRNPMDAYYNVLRSSYAGKLGSSAVDTAGSIMEAARIANRYDIHFDGAFTEETTVEEALRRIAQVIPAVPTPIAGAGNFSIGVSRVRKIPYDQFLFTDYNVVAGSINRSWQFDRESDVDGVEIAYRDPSTFLERTKKAGSTNIGDRYDRIDLFGVTSGTRAQQYANYMWNRMRRMRQVITFEADLSGFLPQFGSRIRTIFDQFDYGQPRRIIRVWWSSGNRYIQLDRPVSSASSMTRAYMRTNWGAPTYTSVRSAPLVNVKYAGLKDGLPTYQMTKVNVAPTPGETVVALGTTGTLGKSWTVTNIRPASADTVEIEAVNYDSSFLTMPGM